MPCCLHASPNFDDRAGGQAPSMIVLHYTGMPTGAEALARLCDPQSKVSAHYVVDLKGKIYNLVSEDKRAWHAGASYWDGERDINSASIGIEIVNTGHEFGYVPFPEAQIQSVIGLCQEIMTRHDIAPARVLGHSDVAPARKIDPGHLFPWQRLAEKGVGVWPEMDNGHKVLLPRKRESFDLDISRSPLSRGTHSGEAFHAALCAHGYDPSAPAEDVILAFHRHFCPERFTAWSDRPTEPDAISAARLGVLGEKEES